MGDTFCNIGFVGRLIVIRIIRIATIGETNKYAKRRSFFFMGNLISNRFPKEVFSEILYMKK